MPNDFFAELKSFFQKLPGIGPRQARRFVYTLVDFSEEERNKIGEAILSLDKYLKRCDNCFRIFTTSSPERDNLFFSPPLLTKERWSGGEVVCVFCSKNSRRDHEKIIVVEKDSDVLSFEKSQVHNGLYFVLGGLFDPLDENQVPKNRINIFSERFKGDRVISTNSVEIILALPSTKLGDFTCEFIKKTIPERFAKITRLARGLSSGVELEYADENTLKHAFLNRK